jgi:hypothetical protein
LFSLAFLKPVYKVLGAESCSGRDTQPAAVSVAANQKCPSKNLPHQKTFVFSFSLLYPVVHKEVEQQFSERGMTL